MEEQAMGCPLCLTSYSAELRSLGAKCGDERDEQEPCPGLLVAYEEVREMQKARYAR